MRYRAIHLVRTHVDIVAYIVFGVLTTVVNVSAYWTCAHALGMSTVPASIVAWMTSVMFAFFTNRRWVFYSEAVGAYAVFTEAIAFFLSRLATGFVDWGGMWLFVDVLGLPDVPIKVLVNGLVIILNYLASKLVVFRHRNNPVVDVGPVTRGK